MSNISQAQSRTPRRQNYGVVSIEDLAVKFAAENPGFFTQKTSPLLDSALCQKLVDKAHREQNLDWSYGDYFVSRSKAWQGSYLEKDQRFTHVGIDVSLPPGTLVHVQADLSIVRVDDDKDPSGGWGPRIIARIEGDDRGLVLAHMQNIRVREGEFYRRGSVLAEVGAPPNNGNWWAHLHIQAVEGGHFRELGGRGFKELDGYVVGADPCLERQQFPDPIRYMPTYWEFPQRAPK